MYGSPRIKEENKTKAVEFIAEYQKKNGYPPSIREIMKHLGIRSTSTVSIYLQELIAEKRLERLNCGDRNVRIPQQPIQRITLTTAAGDTVYIDAQTTKGIDLSSDINILGVQIIPRQQTIIAQSV